MLEMRLIWAGKNLNKAKQNNKRTPKEPNNNFKKMQQGKKRLERCKDLLTIIKKFIIQKLAI